MSLKSPNSSTHYVCTTNHTGSACSITMSSNPDWGDCFTQESPPTPSTQPQPDQEWNKNGKLCVATRIIACLLAQQSFSNKRNVCVTPSQASLALKKRAEMRFSIKLTGEAAVETLGADITLCEWHNSGAVHWFKPVSFARGWFYTLEQNFQVFYCALLLGLRSVESPHSFRGAALKNPPKSPLLNFSYRGLERLLLFLSQALTWLYFCIRWSMTRPETSTKKHSLPSEVALDGRQRRLRRIKSPAHAGWCDCGY